LNKSDTQRRHRRERRLALALLLVLPLAVAAGPRPARVVSVNLCTDQLLLMLADTSQVASVSFLAREPKSSFVSTQAMAYPVNHSRAEEVVSLRPDLVLASAYTPPRLIATLKRLGYRVEQFPLDDRLDGIVKDIRRMAALLDQQARGEALVKEMESRLAGTADTPERERPTALFYQPRGYTSGRHTLQDEALRLAGWRNPAAEHGIEGYAPVDLERVLLWRPQRIFTSEFDGSGDSQAQRALNHPALRKLLAGRQPLQIPYKYWICPGPMLADAVELLRRARSDLGPSHTSTTAARSREAAAP
jgi:iron complex transport system substrate-binding protein